MHWVAGKPPAAPLRCMAKTRYRQADQTCTLAPRADSRWEARFEHPQRAITPGQYAVFYMDDECLGGGVITDTVAYGAEATQLLSTG